MKQQRWMQTASRPGAAPALAGITCAFSLSRPMTLFLTILHSPLSFAAASSFASFPSATFLPIRCLLTCTCTFLFGIALLLITLCIPVRVPATLKCNLRLMCLPAGPSTHAAC